MARHKFIQDPDALQPVQQLLFHHPNSVEAPRYSPYPRILRTLEGFQSVIDSAGEYLDVDLEFTGKRPTIIGISNGREAASLRWSDELGHKVIASGRKLIGYSTIGAEKEVMEGQLGIKTPLTMWEDAMLTHYLDNADLVKAPGKDEADESDAGAMGYMGLATAIMLYSDLPQYKNCRGPACSGPCPRCVRGESLVFLENGKKERIVKLVKDQYSGRVLCVSPDGTLSYRHVTNWYRSPRDGRQFYRLSYRFRHTPTKRPGKRGVVLTEDHLVLSQRGYVRVDSLQPDDLIATGTPAAPKHLEDMLPGILLGDSSIRKGAISVVHGLKQLEYLSYKRLLLESVFNGMPYSVPRANVFVTHQCSYLLSLEDQFKNNWRGYLEKYFTPASLAIWFLDDGHCAPYQCNISVTSYTEDEIDFLCKLIREKCGLHCYPQIGKTCKTIIFPAASVPGLARITAPYAPPCMRYKLSSRVKDLPEFDPSIYLTRHPIPTFWDHPVVTLDKPRNRTDNTVFCLEVEEFNNFVTEGGVVHNCEVWGYNGTDAYAGGKVFHGSVASMRAKNIPFQLYRELLELSEICQKMQNQGVKIDTEYISQLSEKIGNQKYQLYPTYTLRGKEAFQGTYSPRSDKQVIQHFSTLGISLESNDKTEIDQALKKRLGKTTVSKSALETLRTELADLTPKAKSFTLESLLSDHDNLLYAALNRLQVFAEDPGLLELVKLRAYKEAGKGTEPWFGAIKTETRKGVERTTWDDKYLDKDGFVHPRFYSTGTSTGRLSSGRPNFQNIPARGFGKEVRQGIIPREKGWHIAKADFSQLELRMCLYLAGLEPSACGKDAFNWLVDESAGKFEEAARRNNMKARDIAKGISHAGNYCEGFDLLYADDLNSPRIKREVTMGARVIYRNWHYAGGLVSFTGGNLAERLFGSRSLENRKKALDIQEGIYFARFPQIRTWQQKVTEFVDTHGYIQSPTGRYLPLYGTPKDNAKIAVAFLGQGTSADHVQGVMLRFYRELGIVPLMQVHDELVREIHPDWSNKRLFDDFQMMAEETWRLPGFSCPFKLSRGVNWGDAVEIEL
jgi:hypothetical protein